MRGITIIVVSLLVAGIAAGQQVRVVPGDVRLQDLVGSSTLVTVVIKGKGAEDPNLRVVEVLPDMIVAYDEKGERTPYLYESIEEIRVQGGKVEPRSFELSYARMLKGPELEIVQRAASRAASIFQESAADQSVRMAAATLLLLNGNPEAREYLLRLARSGDTETEVEACLALYLAGDPAVVPGTPYPLKPAGASAEAGAPLIPAVTRQGLQHGNRTVRGRAATLAGLVNDTESRNMLLRMLNDRLEEFSAPAARALTQMGDTSIVPKLLEIVMERNSVKGEAAIYGLNKLGDAEVVRKAKDQLSLGTGEVHFRLVRILFHFGDPMGRELMLKTLADTPTLAPMAAVYLGEKGDIDAKVYLHRRVERREDMNEENAAYRSKAAKALILGGDQSGVSILADLLREDDEVISRKVCETITELARTNLLSLTQSPMESVKAKVALDAATTAISLADAEFRDRLLKYRGAL